MGIPVIDPAASYSFASQHPVLATLSILSLIAIAAFMFWISRKLPKHMGKVRVGMFVLYLVLAIPFAWEGFKPHQSPLSQVFEAAQKLQQASEKTGQ